MYIFDFIKPGHFIQHEDKAFIWRLDSLLRHLETSFYEANVALNLFYYEMNKPLPFEDYTAEKYHSEDQARREKEAKIRLEFSTKALAHQSDEHDDYIRFEVDRRVKIEKWSQGEQPLSHSERVIFLHAKSFLNSLDTFDRFMKVISEEPAAPAELQNLHAEIGREFPQLRAVRNSTQHLEDRALGLGPGKKPMELKPVDNDHIVAPQGALMLGNLCGTKFGCTMADGGYGEIDVSPDTLSKFQSILQRVYETFEWVGARQYLPR